MKPHEPIMTQEILDATTDCMNVVDATMGAGGHSRAFLQANANRTLYGIDQDPSVVAYAEGLTQEFGGRFHFVQSNFSAMSKALADAGADQVDAVLMDIGVSSMQLDEAHRGFSFREEGALDMRMSCAGLSAEDVVNDYSAEDLTRIIRTLGEESMARQIVKNIIRHREKTRISTTTQLTAIIHEVKQRRGAKIDPATKTFQALRMHVNGELAALEQGLSAAEGVLCAGGVLCVLSFHSLEDRIVKRFLRDRIEQPQGSRHLPPQELPVPRFALLHRGVMRASSAELDRNPRARSAKLRMARKLEVTA